MPAVEKAEYGKVKVPSFLHNQNQAPSPKPAWMQKLASSQGAASKRMPSSDTIIPKKVGQETPGIPGKHSAIHAKAASFAQKSRRSPNAFESVKEQIKNIQRNIPETGRSVTPDAPSYLLAGTVPKDKRYGNSGGFVSRASMQGAYFRSGAKKDVMDQSQTLNIAQEMAEPGASGHDEIFSELPADIMFIQQINPANQSSKSPNEKQYKDSVPEEARLRREASDNDRKVAIPRSEEDSTRQIFEDNAGDAVVHNENKNNGYRVEEVVLENKDDEEKFIEIQDVFSSDEEEVINDREKRISAPSQSNIPASSSPKLTNNFKISEERYDCRDVEIYGSPQREKNSEDYSWMCPHHYADDSSWTNLSRRVKQERKEHLMEELKRKSVDLFPSEVASYHQLSDNQLSNRDSNQDKSLGFEKQRNGHIISETSLPVASIEQLEAARIIASSVPNSSQESWAMPKSQEIKTYQASSRLALHKYEKDYRFSYIAAQHTHSTSSYADVVRERYFPQQDNDYWAAPTREHLPELRLHILRNGEIASGPFDEKESWMPPEDAKSNEVIDTSKYYEPAIADEKSAEARSVVTDTSDWMGRSKSTFNISARIDFSGRIMGGSSDESFDWNPSVPRRPSIAASEMETSTFGEKAFHPRVHTMNHDSTSVQSAYPRERVVEQKSTVRSGKRNVDIQRKMILVVDDTKEGTKRLPVEGRRTRASAKCVFAGFFFLLILGGFTCVIVFVLDPFSIRDNDTPTGSPVMPTGSPVMLPMPTSTPLESSTQGPSVTSHTLFPSFQGETIRPSPAMTEDALIEFFSRFMSDEGASLRDTSSPQFAAVQWIRTPANQGIFDDRTFLQRFALAALYFSTGGEEWTVSTGWLTDDSECNWYTSSTSSKICDKEGNILELVLDDNNLAGQIPPELNLLSNSLLSLQLESNKLTGTIPKTVSDLSSLATLNLSNNLFRGSVPTAIGMMQNLEKLFLFSNTLHLMIPTEVGGLSSLREIDLGNNNLVGEIPIEFGKLSMLESLALYNNALTGQIPSELGSLSSLRLLYLDNNSFQPSLPDDICMNIMFKEFWTDCSEIGGCNCCTRCCQDGAPCT